MTPHLPWGHGNQPASRAQQLENPRQYGRDEDADGESDPDVPQHPSGNLSDFEGNDEDGEFESDPEFPNPLPGHCGESPAHASASAGPADPYTPRSRKEHMSQDEFKAKVEAVVKEAKNKTQLLREDAYSDPDVLNPSSVRRNLENRMQRIDEWEQSMLAPAAYHYLPTTNALLLEANFQYLSGEIRKMTTAAFRMPSVGRFFTLNVQKRRQNESRNLSTSHRARRRKD